MKELFKINIDDMSLVGETRRLAISFSKLMGFSTSETGSISIIVTELAANLVKHAGSGELFIRALECGKVKGIEILTIDNGPGIGNISNTIKDGFSTTGSQGIGLGAIIRLSSFFDIYSTKGIGTIIMSRFWAGSIGLDSLPAHPLDIGVMSFPKEGEDVCGDGWAVEQNKKKSMIILCDGIGHGRYASEAALTSIDIFKKNKTYSPEAIIEAVHSGLRSTRGAAVMIAEVDHINNVIKYSGIGNISGRIINGETEKNMVSLNGTVGHNIRKIKEFSYPFEESSLLIIHSDGLLSHWKFSDNPDIRNRHPAIISANLYNKCCRGTDDVTVFAAKKARNIEDKITFKDPDYGLYDN